VECHHMGMAPVAPYGVVRSTSSWSVGP
jgi:hypothetical protein